MDVSIRPARSDDLERINEIYNHTVIDSHVSFDLEPWNLERRRRWWGNYDTTGPYRVFVAETDDRVVGIAYSSPYRSKEAYRSSVETTVVVDPTHLSRGIGRALLSTVLDAVAGERIHRAYAIVALPNDASVRLHEALGYRDAGTQDDVGYKFGRYWSTMILEKHIDGNPV